MFLRRICRKKFTFFAYNGTPLNAHTYGTGEASADTVWGNDRWPLHPGNEGKDEPIYIVAHSIWNVTPQAKFIFMVREPVER